MKGRTDYNATNMKHTNVSASHYYTSDYFAISDMPYRSKHAALCPGEKEEMPRPRKDALFIYCYEKYSSKYLSVAW